MAQVINTNSLSLMAQNNLNKSQSSLGTAIERLSSGLRINSAKDDAAGQAISNRFTANIKGLTQASRNANDGISLAQTTEGALNEVNDNLQNIRRLTVQSQNGSNSSSDLQSIQDEITQRLNEINRISEQTDFNGVKVLSSNQKLTIQVGANDGETIDIDLKDINKSTLNLDTFSVAFGVDKASVDTAAVTTATTVTLDKTVAFKEGQQADSKDVLGYVKDDKGGIYARTGASEFYKVETLAKDGTATFAAAAATPSGATKATAEGNIMVKAADNAANDLAKTFAYTGTEKGAPKYVIKDSSGATDRFYAASFDTDGKVVRGAELSSNPATKDPLEALDKALAQVDGLRSSLGAVQNRFDSVINNLNSTVNNLSASQSRIQDADYATEVSNMSRANILQQAGTSVLAQANQSTQNVLTLLR